MKKRIDEKTRVAMIAEIIGGKKQAEMVVKYGYSSPSPVSTIMTKFKAMVTDYSKCHTLGETLEQYADYSVTEQWLDDNNIVCAPPKKTVNVDALLRNYRMGASLDECADIYDITTDEVRKYLIEAHIPIREDEQGDYGEGFITTEDNATDIEYKELPPLHTYDIVWVKNAKLSVEKKVMDVSASRPAIVVSPQDYIDHCYKVKQIANIQVIYGTTKIVADNKYNLVTNCYYTGKETQYSLSRIDSVKIRDILMPRNDTFAHLNDNDIKRLKEKLLCFFVGKINNNDLPKEETIDISDSIIDLFKKGLSRPDIYSFFKNTEYDVSAGEIQSILDKAGYSGIQRNTPVCESEEKVVNATADSELQHKLDICEAKLSVYENIFDKTRTTLTI